MDNKKSPNRTKRSKVLEDNFWDCSVCTYRNTAEAFKCLMCDVRKGTSTRKPPVPTFAAVPPPPPTGKSSRGGGGKRTGSGGGKSSSKNRTWRPPRLKNIDRSSAQTDEITVNNVTVVITEYKPKKRTASEASASSASMSAEEGSQTDTDTRSMDPRSPDSRSS
ncbi:unnamed protein product [Nesidiocoris tenuis]|uniref:RanBP2-type domain-containing protein n=1 Tax=Nesidiocoris tenuis TaxID=355587 RepID=A0A6H5G0X6_9HEMI|nr:unnamed protein product [Nesidiocoris tenuis]